MAKKRSQARQSPARTRRKLRSPKQLAALSSPERMRIVDALAALGPSSARELGAQLSRAPQALYYHLKALQAAGLVEKSASRKTAKQPKGRRGEAVYKLIANELEFDAKNATEEMLQSLADAASALLRLADRQTRATLESGTAQLTGQARNLSVKRLTARLKPAELKQLNKLLDELIEFLAQRQSTDDDATAVSLTFALHPFGY